MTKMSKVEKNAKAVEESPAAERVLEENKKKKKVVKRKVSSKDDQTVGKKIKEAAVDDTYKPGALGSLFGSTSGDLDTTGIASQEVLVGEKTIKKKKSKVVAKAKKSEKTTEGEGKEAEENQEEKTGGPAVNGEKKRDRTEERANRKKGKGGMTLEDKKVTVFVGNMPLTMNVKIVKKMFSQYGAVDSVRMRSVIPPKDTLTKRITHVTGVFHEKQASLNFYVKFKEPESVAKALKFNGSELEGHKIRVDTVEGKRDYDKNFTIYVGNLPFDVTEDALSSFFEENVGPVDFSRCIRDGKTGMGKGFAFVHFKSSASLDLALGMNGLTFQKRELRITKVMQKKKLEKAREAQKRIAKSSAGVSKQPSKIDKYKFSTKKERTDEQNIRRGLKKSAKKAIHRKAAKKQGKSLMK